MSRTALAAIKQTATGANAEWHLLYNFTLAPGEVVQIVEVAFQRSSV
ncbi:MAG: hypothetical protein Rhob2KO_12800 [Rhodopirellula baltica]